MKNSVLFFSFLLVLPFATSLHFKISRFIQGDPSITYQGDATPNGAIELNSADYTCRVGWATYAKKVAIWDPKTERATDFTTSFTFKIDTRKRNLTEFGHGFAFFLAPQGIHIFPNSAGGFLGLFNETNGYSSRFPLVHIEFDTFYNNQWDPFDITSHVGINNNSLASSNYTSWNASLHSQETCHARITYDSTSKNLSIAWSYEGTSHPSSLSYIIDLAKVLPAEVTIGFSGSTGAKMEAHRILSWEFNSTLDAAEPRERTQNMTGIIVGVSLAGFVLLTSLVAAAFALFRKRKQRKERAGKTENLTSLHEDLERGAGPRRFSYKDLASATSNFLYERKLGEGGFGAVYKGYLNELDTMVAVKKFSGASKQGKKEFITEVKIISSLRHRNLVLLIGWCHEKQELLLVYEFMPNGSLDSHLFGKKPHLRWAVRCKISLGVASALLYLHEEWEQCIVHRDIKASNIMLDSNFNAKLGDFGLARLMDHELGPQTTGLAGTFGYMAPEYISTGRASKESDVYSFGIVLVEIVTGKKSVEPRQGKVEPEASLVERVWDQYGRGELISAIDHQMGKDFDMKQAECLMIVGLWCAHPDINSRPSIKQAIQVLNFEAPLPNLPHKMPIATYHVSSISGGVATTSFSSAQLGR
ncbi:L-type lectin-domain containing receptor kinase IX.1-like [Brassica napus]|uniref:(rape) hypothetical protein n=1 Tax=Brassica napus TaxID=3708 RepID=A0A816UC00_BRANA|nr:L-type lectin-domain containing receptor kinase IX.1-like [Brassica napus]CAF2109224.1 unnamed protein product [Brassica napus]